MEAFSGKTVWLTRPQFQIEALQQQLTAAGAQTVHLPMFEIRPIPYDQKIRDLVLQLDQFELVFFISTNAARLGLDCFMHFWAQLPVGLNWFAVGPTTAEVLEQEGLTVHYPKERMSSEALLALPELSDIDGRKALICRGVGGRETLARGLGEKGASVTYLELYQRAVPEYDRQFLLDLTRDKKPDAIVVTSSEALANLCQLLESLWPELLEMPLLVSSERIFSDAVSAGFSRVTAMTGASDPCIMDGLKDLFH